MKPSSALNLGSQLLSVLELQNSVQNIIRAAIRKGIQSGFRLPVTPQCSRSHDGVGLAAASSPGSCSE